MKILDCFKRLWTRTHHGDFSIAAFQDDFEKFSRIGIIIYSDYLDVLKSTVRNQFFFLEENALPVVRLSGSDPDAMVRNLILIMGSAGPGPATLSAN